MQPQKPVQAPLLYFFPDRESPTAELSNRLANVAMKASGRVLGPGKKRGFLCAPHACGMLGYKPERQRWSQPLPGVHIGIDQDAKPEHFLLDKDPVGFRITLGDDNEWIIPCLNPNSGYCTLPTIETLDCGKWVTQVKDPYQHLIHKCLALVEHVVAALLDSTELESEIYRELTIEEDLCRPAIATAIAQNYDLTLIELACLHVFSAETYFAAICAVTDYDEVQKAVLGLAKEKAGAVNPTDGVPATSATAAGTPEETTSVPNSTDPNTNPPSSTSTSRQTTEAAA